VITTRALPPLPGMIMITDSMFFFDLFPNNVCKTVLGWVCIGNGINNDTVVKI
jgi:hypothetical protein